MKKLFILIIILSGCRSKKVVTEYKERIVKDTVYTTKTIKEVKRFTDTLTIESPCDSLGNLKPFNQLIKVPQGNIKLNGLNNVISAEIDLNGYKDQLEKTYQLKYREFTENYSSEIETYKTPFWHWIVHILCFAIIILLFRIRF